MELTGKIIAVLEAKSGVSARTGNGWMTQEYVMEVSGQFPKRCVFSIIGEDRIKQFNIQSGEDLTIQFDIVAREFNGRWYNDVRTYRVIRSQQTAQPIVTNSVSSESPFPPINEVSGNDVEDLPF